MSHLPLPDYDWLKEYLAPNQSVLSGLIWIKQYCKMKPGDMAGSINTNGYYQVRIKGKLYLIHRVVYYLIHQQDPGSLLIDHIKSKDNHLDTRLATNSQNNLYSNKTGIQKSSKYKGVTWDRNKWKARISYQGTVYDLGRFDNEEDAAKAYDNKAKELNFEFAILNFSQSS